MSLEYCTKCNNEFLTEADDYVVTPREAYALTCIKCYFGQLQAENEKLKIELKEWKIRSGKYGVNIFRPEGCTCPDFYKKENAFSGVDYHCPLHGR